MESVGWLDGCRRPVVSWRHYLRQRWLSEQSQREQPRAMPRGRRDTRPPVPPRHSSPADFQQDITTL